MAPASDPPPGDDPAYRRNPAVNATEVDEEIFLIDPEGSEVFYLDAVSSALWRIIETPCRRSEIVETFAAAFPDEPPARLAADIDAALADLTARGLALAVAGD